MNRHSLIFAAAAFACAGLAQAAIVTNGDFETNFATVGTTFDLTPNWFNRGTGGQTTNARATNLNLAGSSYNAVVNDRYDVVNATSDFDAAAFGTVVHSQSTGYTIQSGDAFQLQYQWRDAGEWNAGLDEIRFVLFATDNNALGGNVVWWVVLDSGTSTQTTTWEAVDQTTATVDTAAVGQSLFVNFFGFQNNGALSANTGFARVDNIEITAVPEPATYALLTGVAVFGLLLWRRRLRR